jgi:hypothetical protein
VYPNEIEDVIATMPGVLEVAPSACPTTAPAKRSRS